eukprot:6607431-Alexandrium_andersonii.AAC.1
MASPVKTELDQAETQTIPGEAGAVLTAVGDGGGEVPGSADMSTLQMAENPDRATEVMPRGKDSPKSP